MVFTDKYKLCAVLLLTLLVSCTPSKNRQVHNLEAFCRLYGYVKYFHPSHEANKLDWDKFAIWGSEKIINAKNDIALARILQELFLPVAPSILITENKTDTLAAFPANDTCSTSVYWQHLGVDLGFNPEMYQSMRVNSEVDTIAAYALVLQNIDATKYRNKKLVLEAYGKSDYALNDPLARFFLFDGKGIFKQEYLAAQPGVIINSANWRKYSSSKIIGSDSEWICFGCYSQGQGETFVDSFKLFVEESDGKRRPLDLYNSGFEYSDSLKTPVIWEIHSSCYSIQSANKDPIEGESCLMLAYLGRLFPDCPGRNEVYKAQLASNIFLHLPLTIPTCSYSPHSESTAFLDIVKKLEQIDKSTLSAKNKSVRLGDIIIAWNVYQHFYPYFDEISVDWSLVLDVALRKALDQNEGDFQNTLKWMIANLRDGHGRVTSDKKITRWGLPIRVDLIDDQVVVTASNDPLLKVGDVITKLDGHSAEKVFENSFKYLSGSPQLQHYIACNTFGYAAKRERIKIEILRNNQKLRLTTERNVSHQDYHLDPISEFDYPSTMILHDSIIYINAAKVTQAEFDKLISTHGNPAGYIFDVRRSYGRSIHLGSVIPHLITKEVQTPLFAIPKVIYPDRSHLDYQLGKWYFMPQRPLLKSETVILTSNSIMSAGETLLSTIKYYKLATLIGEVSAGCNGNVNNLNLPGGFQIAWTGMKALNQDGTQHFLKGIEPDIAVVRNYEDVLNKKDTCLETALSFLNH